MWIRRAHPHHTVRLENTQTKMLEAGVKAYAKIILENIFS
jgi:hypothetical protein